MELDDCGCCEGRSGETPELIHNRPGLDAIAYRVGTHATFKESMLARLASAEFPALGLLRTRDDDDPTIALYDAAATMLDVLTFYQERLAGESYLRTARERRSVLDLAKLIGYEPNPGVAANTYLAFTMQEAPGTPGQPQTRATVPVGTRVQSVPGPDEQPQTFETVEAIEARPEWNAMPVQLSERWKPHPHDADLYLAGTQTQLQPGDVILIVGSEQEARPDSNNWDLRTLQRVEIDTANDRTRISWKIGVLRAATSDGSGEVKVYVFRQRAALFGHNALNPLLLNLRTAQLNRLTDLDVATRSREWKFFGVGPDQIELDSSYPKVLSDSWVALVSESGHMELRLAKSVTLAPRSDFGLSAKITRLKLDREITSESFNRRTTSVLIQSERLVVAERPIHSPLFGGIIPLRRRIEGLVRGRAVAVSGKLQRLRIADDAKDLELLRHFPESNVPLSPGDTLTLIAAPHFYSQPKPLDSSEFSRVMSSPLPTALVLELLDREGRRGTLSTTSNLIQLVPATKDDETLHEISFISNNPDGVSMVGERTTLRLAVELKNFYDRATVVINANVAAATHGESVSEIAGSGNAATLNQRFRLRQSPLTYVGTSTVSGGTSTLEVRVNDLSWREAPTLFARAPTDRFYTTDLDDEGRTTVVFGDGVEGARLPTGQDNVRVTYRKGIGSVGNVRARSLTSLVTRPLGVVEATNPEPATGGADPQSLNDARNSAPLTVLTLERAVSVRDYEDFARAFAGIAKAHALWVPSGPGRGVFVTVSGIDGAPVPEGSRIWRDLLAALRRFGDPLVPLSLVSYRDTRFRLRATVTIAPDARPEAVLAQVTDGLRRHFGFSNRSFGQPVSVDEVAAVVHRVVGVVAVDIDHLNLGRPPLLRPRLFAAVPVASPRVQPKPAELLTIDVTKLQLSGVSV